MAERTSLEITTIGSFDMSKAEREEERKRKRREAERARRARNSSGRPRGRPKKMRGQQSKDILLATDFRPNTDEARETPKNKSHDDRLDNRASARLISASDLAMKRYKSRIPESLRPTQAQIDFAVDAGFDRVTVSNMFEHFHNHHLAIGSYASDWGEMWKSWVLTRVDIDTAWHCRSRARMFAMAMRPSITMEAERGVRSRGRTF